ncbi:hypothetical protein F511_25912 [Dorcoceras hygrometricum]|uniref:Uncharacterized protein n=1 Tax=Dorcoceras hygrometricum TaxID=472368 RepID=A0A2Z7AAU2_9LAMI|nr:hypothetical protein F511_25912 [Dorcoceras hygrometricum]
MKELEMVDVNDEDHMLDIEEVFHYYSQLSCPVYLEIVDKFFMDIDAPYYHLGAREPDRSPQGHSAHQLLGCRTETKQYATHLTYVVKLGSWTEDSLPVRGCFPSLLSRRAGGSCQIRISLFEESWNDTSFLVCITRSPKIAERISLGRDLRRDMLISNRLAPL